MKTAKKAGPTLTRLIDIAIIVAAFGAFAQAILAIQVERAVSTPPLDRRTSSLESFIAVKLNAGGELADFASGLSAGAPRGLLSKLRFWLYPESLDGVAFAVHPLRVVTQTKRA